MSRASRSRLVYSSEAQVRPGRGRPQSDGRRATDSEETVPKKVVAKLRIEKSGRRGKTVTVVEGLPRNRSFLAQLAADLKKACGTGGKAGETSIEIQGDQRDTVRVRLRARGWTVKG